MPGRVASASTLGRVGSIPAVSTPANLTPATASAAASSPRCPGQQPALRQADSNAATAVPSARPAGDWQGPRPATRHREQRARLAASLHPRRLASGENLFRQGDLGDRFFVITAGSLNVFSGDAPTGEALHWADDGWLDLLQPLLAHAAELPLALVMTARPALLERRPSG